MLWSLVLDGLITVLKDQGFEITAYANDLVVMVRGKHEAALDVIWEWCLSEGLGVNPNKTVIIPFNRRRKLAIENPVSLKLNISE